LNTTLLQTKLYRPPLARDIIERRELLDELEFGFSLPLTLVCSPSGFGKSTLTSYWMGESGHPGAWVSLDEEDNDPLLFAGYFVEAIRSVFPSCCEHSFRMLSSSELPAADEYARVLLNDLQEISSRFTLALDDFHVIHDEWILDFTSALIRRPASPIHLVIMTRMDPPLPLEAVRAAGHVTEIRAGQMRFGTREVHAFLTASLDRDVDAESVVQVHRNTEGWPAGLRLVAQSLRGRKSTAEILTGIHGGTRQAFDRLVSEMLEEQPPAVHKMLLATSVVSRFSRSLSETLCPALTGNEFFECLRSGNLFTVPLDDHEGWIRYHHLFKSYLLERLSETESQQAVLELHRRAAEWLYTH
jgi:LuxR family maltose regulon positive regulatory protein